MLGHILISLQNFRLEHGDLAQYALPPDPGDDPLPARVTVTVTELLRLQSPTIATAVQVLRELVTHKGWPHDDEVTYDLGQALSFLLYENWKQILAQIGGEPGFIALFDELKQTPFACEPETGKDFRPTFCMMMALAYLCDR